MSVWLAWLPLWLWLAAAALFLLLSAAAWLSPRAVRLRVRAAWWRSSPARTGLRFVFPAGLALLAASLLFALSAGEAPAVRFAAAAAAGITFWLAADFAWRAARSAALSRAALHREWNDRASAALRELAAISEEPLLPSAACRILCERLGCSGAALYWASEAGYRLLAAHPDSSGFPDSWDSLSPLVRTLASHTEEALPLALAAGSSLAGTGSVGIGSWSQAQPDPSGAAAAAPLAHGALLEGFLLAGPLNSGESYGPAHLAFLEKFAAAVTLLRESAASASRLAERSAAAARQEARAASVRLALSALQPPEEVALPDLDCAGIAENGAHCRVFLDMVSLPGRAAAFAAVEMDSGFEEAAVRLVLLQALLRSRMRAYHEDLAELAESTRRALAGGGAGWPPARLFLARYRSGTRRLHYINAGFFPPFLFRRTADGAEALRLKHTGPPLDAETVFRCEEAEIELAPGDLLLAVSSTVPAAENSGGEAWGDASIIETLAGWRPDSARNLLEETFSAWKQHLGAPAQLPPHLFLLLRPRP
ncbi:MAG: SpoIIE family protein phosphatase [Bryobacteraceae bacterium]